MTSPILFIIFKRPDTTRTVFNRIREARPPRLYIAADGPRPDKKGEREMCEATRQVVETIDWPCEVHHLYRDENMGCGKGVSSAISWFFEHEEQGIIIEDDIVPHLDFFTYCDEMLERYKDDERIQMISGCNYFYDGYQSAYSYYMSTFACIWGWATWRRVWNTYQFDVNAYPEEDIKRKIMLKFPKGANTFFLQIYDQMKRHAVDTWDFQFVLNQTYYNRYSISPFTNMIENIGMGDINATHTTAEDVVVSNHKSSSPYPIKHPEHVMPDSKADDIAMINSRQYVTIEQIVRNTLIENGLTPTSKNNVERLERKLRKYRRLVKILAVVAFVLLLLSLLLTTILLQGK